MTRCKSIQAHVQGESVDSAEEDIFLTITLCRVPADLLQEFARRVVVNYTGGLSEAVQDLMRRALKE